MTLSPRVRVRPRGVVLALALVALGAACRQDMHDQARLEPLEASTFFSDGQGARRLVAGTVARGQLDEDPLHSAFDSRGELSRAYPLSVTPALLARGRERYNIFCSPCHGELGDGLGMIVRRGFRQPPSFHIERLREAPPGHYFQVMTNGSGMMPSYAAQVRARDRWAIAAYIQALQLSQRAPAALLTQADRARFERTGEPEALAPRPAQDIQADPARRAPIEPSGAPSGGAGP